MVADSLKVHSVDTAHLIGRALECLLSLYVYDPIHEGGALVTPNTSLPFHHSEMRFHRDLCRAH